MILSYIIVGIILAISYINTVEGYWRNKFPTPIHLDEFTKEFIKEVNLPPKNNVISISFFKRGKLCDEPAVKTLLADEFCDADSKRKSIIGMCFGTMSRGYNGKINVAIKLAIDYKDNEELLLHELSHCLYDIDHSGEGISINHPYIMHEYLIGLNNLKYHRNILIKHIREIYD